MYIFLVSHLWKSRLSKDGAGSYTFRVGRHTWSINYIHELRKWTAYDITETDLAIGPRDTLREIRDVLESTLCVCGN